MGEVRNIDVENFRKSRSARLREQLVDLACRFSHRGWIEADARIEICGAMEVLDFGSTGGHAVVLSYEVDGMRYEAEAISLVKAEKGEIVKIRYNPRNPEQNNSFGSETNWTSPVFRIGTILMVLMLLGLLLAGVLLR